MLREIDDVVATADGRHALILCTDGGIIYFNRADEALGGGMIELPRVQRDPDCTTGAGRGWGLRRVGQCGEVLMLRTTQTNPVTVIVSPLSDEFHEAKATAVAESWTEWGYFLDKSAPEINDAMLVPADRAVFPLVTPAQKGGAPSSGGMVRAASTGSLPSSNSSAPRTSSGRPPLVPVVGEKMAVKRVRKTSVAPMHRITPAPQLHGHSAQRQATTTPVEEQPRSHHASRVKYIEMQEYQEEYEYYAEPEAAPAKRRALVLTQPPKIRRVVEVPMRPVTATPRTKPRLSSIVYERFTSMCSSWIESNKRGQGRADAVLAKDDRSLQALGVNTLRQLGAICVVQDRLRSQFVGDVARCIARHLQSSLNEDEGNGSVDLGSAGAEVDAIVRRYEAAANDLVVRQQMDLTGVFAMDSLLVHDGGQPRGLKIVFRHGEIWNSAREFLRTTDLLLGAALTTQQSHGPVLEKKRTCC